MLMRKYLIGKKILPDGVFQIEEPAHTRQSQRLLARSNRSSMLVKRFRDQKNKKEQKMAAEHMRSLWNALDDEVVNADSFAKLKVTMSITHCVSCVMRVR